VARRGNRGPVQGLGGSLPESPPDYATCELAATPGSQRVDPTVQLIVKIHDETTLAESNLDLA
jgi:hypothetical protein